MTSFGRYRDSVGGKDITVELKSVNNRFFDCQTRLPRAYSHIDPRIKPYLASRGIFRGKVDVSIVIAETDGNDVDITLNTEYARKYVEALKRLKEELDLPGDITVMDVAKNQDVFSFTAPETDAEREWEEIRFVLSVAVDKFLEARTREGKRIEDDLKAKMAGIRAIVAKVKGLSEGDIDGYRLRLEEKIRAVLADNSITIDESRILTECAIYADKAAIDEEIVRLESHFCAFDEYLAKDEPVGRSLDFLLQEMNREINTIGSKCGNSDIARCVVEVKTELEKIREQIQNIE